MHLSTSQLIYENLFTMMLFRHCILFGSILLSASAWSTSPSNEKVPQSSRRKVLASVVATAFLPILPVQAFDNRISDKYDDRPKQRGGQARDLGVGKRKDMVGEEYVGLKNCGGAPNCFCSTDNAEDDPEHVIPAWKWPKSLNVNEAFAQLDSTVNDYQPGQENIDGGGFKVVTSKPGYIYAQFEALKNGYVDDVEFATIDGLEGVQVRSSSRLGYLDYGVNAKRLNFIAAALRKLGWEAEGVDFKKHADYADQNRVV